jgi:signal transduction histidine kinase
MADAAANRMVESGVAAEDLGARRMRVLRDLAMDAGTAPSLELYFAAAARSLAKAPLDLPLVLFYALDEECRGARLVAHVGPAGQPWSAREVAVERDGAAGWPLKEALEAARPLALDDVAARFPGLVAGSDSRPIERAYVLPVHARGSQATALVVAGASPALPMDEAYTAFFELLAATLTNGVAGVVAVEAERRRADALAEIERDKAAFFSNVSQEFRKRLTLMIGPIEEELGESSQPLPPGRHARLEIAHRNSLRLVRLVETLVDLSLIEEGRMKPSFEPVDLVSLTEELATSFRQPIERAGLRLSTRLEALPEPVYVDREMWTKVILNLLSNALKHTFRGGITVSLFVSQEANGKVELRVDDTGTGIPAKEVPRLFRPFHHVKGVRSRADDGSGIGLALVRAVARLHGGDALAVSREGLGSSFRVHVPRGSEHLPQDRVVARLATATDGAPLRAYVDEAARWSEPQEPTTEMRIELHEDAGDAEPTSGRRPRVLFGDGNSDMRSYVARLLHRAYDVVAVGDGEAAFKEALANPPDLFLLDVMLPGRDGLALLRELRSLEATSLTPVILVSSRAGEDAALEGLDAGADDYVVKPFTAKALVARVRSCLALAKLRKDAAEKLAEANKELEAFSYSVSHDLRAPLRAIDGFSKALAGDYADRFDDEGRRYLDRIRAGTQRMAQLIDDLLSLSRITRQQLVYQAMDVTALARKVLVELAARDPKRKVDWSVTEGMTGHGDPRLLTVMLENLLGNAWKFSSKRPDARIEVGSQNVDGETRFFIRDNGAGFEMQYAAKLFAPFQRMHSVTEFPGTGIGLATVHRVVTRHGGRIWADSAPQKGATFFFTLGEQPR